MNMSSFDTSNLRQNADFEVLISKGLYWVPLNRLGHTRYDQYSILKIVKLLAEEKRKRIASVYEAIQLLQNSNFDYYSNSNCNGEKIGNIFWIHHKPGYISVRTNTGCCTDLASWLDYLIQDIYPYRGYLWFFRPDSSNHVLNYIFYKGFYYIVDVTAMLREKSKQCCPENGRRVDYINSLYPTGVCFKCKELYAFVKYHDRIQKFHRHAFLYTDVSSHSTIPPIGAEVSGSNLTVYFSFPCKIILDSPRIQYLFKKQFNYSPNWNFYSEEKDIK